MWRLITVLAAGVGLLSIAYSAPKPGDRPPPLYYATAKGTKWVYECNGQERVEWIRDIEDLEDEKQLAIANSDVAFLDLVGVSPRGVNYKPCDNAKPLWLLKLPHTHGQTWTTKLEGPDLPPFVENFMRADGPEEIEVPAGKFQAVRVTGVCFDDKKLIRNQIWYAPNVGKVKEVDGDKITVLKSFTPGRE